MDTKCVDHVQYAVVTIAIGLLLVGGIAVGVAGGAESSIRDVRIVDTVDKDGDGYVSSFSIQISADTDCYQCNDESADDPNIDPSFDIHVDRGDGFTDIGGTEILANDENLQVTIPYGDEPGAEIDTAAPQELRVRIKLIDSDPVLGETIDKETISVRIESPSEDENHPPSAEFSFNPRTGQRGAAVVFDAGDSADSDAPIETFRWDFDSDGTTDATGQTVRRTFDQTGDRIVRLEVVDTAGTTDAVERSVTITHDSDGDFLVDSVDPLPASRPLPLVPLGLLGIALGYFILGWLRDRTAARRSTGRTPPSRRESGGESSGTTGHSSSDTAVYPDTDSDTKVYEQDKDD